MSIFVTGLGLMAGCGTPRSSRQNAPPVDVGSHLAELRQRLERVHAAAPDASLELGGGDVQWLLGVERAEIEAALGAPHECEMRNAEVCAARPGQPLDCRMRRMAAPAPCEHGDDVFYSFYHLPEGWNGGGPELRLRFDRVHRVTEARWLHTQ